MVHLSRHTRRRHAPPRLIARHTTFNGICEWRPRQRDSLRPECVAETRRESLVSRRRSCQLRAARLRPGTWRLQRRTVEPHGKLRHRCTEDCGPLWPENYGHKKADSWRGASCARRKVSSGTAITQRRLPYCRQQNATYCIPARPRPGPKGGSPERLARSSDPRRGGRRTVCRSCSGSADPAGQTPSGVAVCSECRCLHVWLDIIRHSPLPVARQPPPRRRPAKPLRPEFDFCVTEIKPRAVAGRVVLRPPLSRMNACMAAWAGVRGAVPPCALGVCVREGCSCASMCAGACVILRDSWNAASRSEGASGSRQVPSPSGFLGPSPPTPWGRDLGVRGCLTRQACFLPVFPLRVDDVVLEVVPEVVPTSPRCSRSIPRRPKRRSPPRCVPTRRHFLEAPPPLLPRNDGWLAS